MPSTTMKQHNVPITKNQTLSELLEYLLHIVTEAVSKKQKEELFPHKTQIKYTH